MKAIIAACLMVLLASAAQAFEPLFDTRVDYYAGVMLSYATSADIDNDGWADLISLEWLDTDLAHVFIRRNLGNGTFGDPVSYHVGLGPRQVICRDFDGDGNIDLAVTNYVSNNIGILLNQGNGTFGSQRTFSVSTPWAIDAFDFDNDGDQDLVVADYDHNSVVFFTNTAGSFQRSATIGVSSTPVGLVNGDFNADGQTDIAVLCYSNTAGNIMILMNQSGVFRFAENVPTRSRANAIAGGDIDGDGDIDLAYVDYHEWYSTSIVTIVTNDGVGTFYPHHSFSYLGKPKSILFTDLDDDGDNDLAGVCDGTLNEMGRYAICLNNGDGTFGPVADYGLGVEPFNVFAVDIDNDGDLDLGASLRTNGNETSILKNRGDGTFQQGDYQYGMQCPVKIIPEDFNADGIKDLAILSCYDSLFIYLGRGDGSFERYQSYPYNNGWMMEAADFDGDNLPDLAVPSATWDSTIVTIYVNLGDAQFVPMNSFEIDPVLYTFQSADFNEDNMPDLAVGRSDDIDIYISEGHGTFAPPVRYAAGTVMNELEAADVDLDGHIDLISGNDYDPHAVTVLFNNGNGQFSERFDLPFAARIYSLHVSDFNGDSYPDLALNGSYTHSIALNNGNRTFAAPREIPSIIGDFYQAATDMDNDGNTDILARNVDNIVIFWNDGNASFETTVGYGVPYDCNGMVTSDLDNDGDQDVIIFMKYADDIAVFLNRTVEALNIYDQSAMPKEFVFSRNYPNPFNARTVIEYELAVPSLVSIDIFDILGRRVETIEQGRQPGGQHSVIWDATKQSSGIYFYRLKAGERTALNKMLLIK